MRSQSVLKVTVLAAFFLSGLSALIYEVVWVRMLTLTFGTTVFAVSAVLSAFMGGLALGSYLFGRIVDRIDKPLRLYILLELGIGLYGLLTPFLIKHIDTVYVPFVGGLSDSFYLLSIIRFFLAFVIILVGTAFMGATLPVLSRFYVKTIGEAGRGIGTLYGLNTTGGVVGVALSGFVLIPFVGVKETLFTAVALNLLIGAGLFLYLRSSSGEGVSKTPGKSAKPGEKEETGRAHPGSPGSRWIIIAFAISGFTALGYEVVWTRVLSLVIGSSVYAFSTMLVTFLVGIALGSFVMSALLEKVKGREFLWFAVIEGAIAISVLLVTTFSGELPMLFLSLAQGVSRDFFGIQVLQSSISIIVMLPTAVLFGALFPLVCRMYIDEMENLGAEVGRLYAANTVGTILGAFAAGFVLIPLAGSETSLKLLTWINAGVACVFFLVFAEISISARRVSAFFLTAVVVVLSLSAPAWEPLKMNSNLPNLLRVIAEKPDILDSYLGSEVVYTDEDITGNTLIYRTEEGSLNLHVGGHAEGGSHPADMPVQIELAVLPALMHSNPKQVLVVGLGAGITLGALEQMEGVSEIDAVEISTGVVKAVGVFSEYNNNALEDKRLNLIIDDARHFLTHTDKKYDLILVGPSYVWVTGTANLFTREFLELAKGHLNTGGIVALWFQLYSMRPFNIKTFVRTVTESFPFASLHLTTTNAELIALGSPEPHAFDYAALTRNLKLDRVADEVGRVTLPKPESLVGMYLMGGDEAREYAGLAPVNTDNHPWLEYSAPRHQYNWDLLENIESLFANTRTSVALVENLSYVKGGVTFYPFIGIRTKTKGWEGEPSYLNIHELSVPGYGAGKRPLRTTIPRVVFSSSQYRLDLRANSSGPPGRGELKGSMAGITGRASTEIKRADLGGRPLYWTLVGDDKAEGYLLTWYCAESGMRYLGRVDVFDKARTGSAPGFGRVLSVLERGIECYRP